MMELFIPAVFRDTCSSSQTIRRKNKPLVSLTVVAPNFSTAVLAFSDIESLVVLRSLIEHTDNTFMLNGKDAVLKHK